MNIQHVIGFLAGVAFISLIGLVWYLGEKIVAVFNGGFAIIVKSYDGVADDRPQPAISESSPGNPGYSL